MDDETVPVRLPQAFRLPPEGTSQCLPERSIQKILLRSRPRGILEFVCRIAALYSFCYGFLGCHRRSFSLLSCLILRPTMGCPLASQSTTGSPISPWHGICSLIALAEIGQHAAWQGGGHMEQHQPSQQQPPQHQDRQPGIESAMTPRPRAGRELWSRCAHAAPRAARGGCPELCVSRLG
jgi:hypothetical protein